MKHFLLTSLCLLIGLCQLKAQKKLSELPLRIAILDETIALPNSTWNRFSFNPGILVGTEYSFKEKGSSELFAAANLGYYYHPSWQSTFFLNAELGYRLNIQRWNVFLKAGAGYSHSFTPGTIYTSSESGLVEATDWGYGKFMPSASLGFGYRLGEDPYSPEIFAQASAAAELPLTIYSGAHQFVGLGIQLYPFNNK
ncbi:MAG: hypothetical protein MRZ79_15035 [Bacteroidia bacterium]|nr:hypothetical protein [Bacteroidia bacterium]